MQAAGVYSSVTNIRTQKPGLTARAGLGYAKAPVSHEIKDSVRFSGAEKTIATLRAYPEIEGTGPVSDVVIRRVVRNLGQKWGIPEALLPPVRWEGENTGRLGSNGGVENRVTLNPNSPPECILQTLQHELYHNFKAIALATLPNQELLSQLKDVFVDCIRDDQFFTLPLREGEETKLYQMPRLNKEQRAELATAFDYWISHSKIRGLKDFTIESAPHIQPIMRKLLKDAFNGSKEALQTMTTTLFEFYVFSMHRQIYDQRRENLQKRMEGLTFQLPEGSVQIKDLLKDELLTGERTRASKYAPPIENDFLGLGFEDSYKANMKWRLPYIFCPEEVQARIHEEVLFNALHDQCAQNKGWTESAAWPVMTAERELSETKVGSLSKGMALLASHGREAFDTHWSDLMSYYSHYRDSNEDIRHKAVLYWISDSGERKALIQQDSQALRTAQKALRASGKVPHLSRLLDRWVGFETKDDLESRFRSEDIERECQVRTKQAAVRKLEETLSLYRQLEKCPVPSDSI